jgi:RNA polymerase sigma-70 factor (ECF subfamily)
LKEYTDINARDEVDALVDKAKNGDAEAFGKIYDSHVNRVYRHIYYRVNSIVDAEDLTQQVFMKAWDAISRYKKTTSPFLAWLIRISNNLVVDFYRSYKTREYLEYDNLADESAEAPVDMAEAHSNRELIYRAIPDLSNEQQQVIVMRFIDGFTYPEIAATLGKSEGAVRVILHRSLTKLKKILEKEM